MRRLTHWVPTLICSLIRAETNILKFQFKAEAAATVTRADLKAVELLFHPKTCHGSSGELGERFTAEERSMPTLVDYRL